MKERGRGRDLNRSFDEVQVFNGVAERTGVTVERDGVRGHRGVCRSVTELCAKSRRMGDGYYYLATTAWPDGETSVSLSRPWATIG